MVIVIGEIKEDKQENITYIYKIKYITCFNKLLHHLSSAAMYKKVEPWGVNVPFIYLSIFYWVLELSLYSLIKSMINTLTL